jgi:transposase
MIFVGDDWAEDHHDIHVMDADGARLASRRLPEGLPGIRGFHELVAAHAEEPSQVVVGIETDRGLWVQALGAAGYQVYAVNPLAVARYRDRHQVSGAKSDPGDAKLLADLVRTDRHNHRLMAGDSSQAEAIKVLARGHQNLIWAAPATPTHCVRHCVSTTQQRSRRSTTCTTATLWPFWAALPLLLKQRI